MEGAGMEWDDFELLFPSLEDPQLPESLFQQEPALESKINCHDGRIMQRTSSGPPPPLPHLDVSSSDWDNIYSSFPSPSQFLNSDVDWPDDGDTPVPTADPLCNVFHTPDKSRTWSLCPSLICPEDATVSAESRLCDEGNGGHTSAHGLWEKPSSVGPLCDKEKHDSVASHVEEYLADIGSPGGGFVERMCHQPGCNEHALFADMGGLSCWCEYHCGKETEPLVVVSETQTSAGYRCKHIGCKTRASYGFPDGPKSISGRTTPVRCSLHKEPGMVNVVSRTCEVEGCTLQSGFGFPGQRFSHCFRHKSQGMLERRSRKCKATKCKKQAAWGLPGLPDGMLWCQEHMPPGSVHLKNPGREPMRAVQPQYKESISVIQREANGPLTTAGHTNGPHAIPHACDKRVH